MSKPPPTLTPRRQHVLIEAARGRTRREIAHRLGVCESTVQDDLKAIARILHAPRGSRASIVAQACTLGVLETPALDRRPIVLVTPMQRLILKGVARGLTNPQLGERLYLSSDAAASYVKRLLVKFGARDRAHLVALAFQQGHLRSNDFPREARP